MVEITAKNRIKKTSSLRSDSAEKKRTIQVLDKIESLRDMPLEERRKEAEKPIYLVRYE
jgi:hypothetical protein